MPYPSLLWNLMERNLDLWSEKRSQGSILPLSSQCDSGQGPRPLCLSFLMVTLAFLIWRWLEELGESLHNGTCAESSLRGEAQFTPFPTLAGVRIYSSISVLFHSQMFIECQAQGTRRWGTRWELPWLEEIGLPEAGGVPWCPGLPREH